MYARIVTGPMQKCDMERYRVYVCVVLCRGTEHSLIVLRAPGRKDVSLEARTENSTLAQEQG